MVAYARGIHEWVSDGLDYASFQKLINHGTFQEVSEYISRYAGQYRAARARTYPNRRENQSFIEPFLEDWGVSASDMGIFPWGES